MRNDTQKGFAVMELLLIIVALGIIAVVAWRVIDASGTVQQTANSVPQNTSVVSGTQKAAVTPQTTNDLNTLSNQLDNTNVDGSAAADLTTQSAF